MLKTPAGPTDRPLESAPHSGLVWFAEEGMNNGEPNSGLVWFAEESMNNGAPLESYMIHAERTGDRELATFFRRALAECRRREA